MPQTEVGKPKLLYRPWFLKPDQIPLLEADDSGDLFDVPCEPATSLYQRTKEEHNHVSYDEDLWDAVDASLRAVR